MKVWIATRTLSFRGRVVAAPGDPVPPDFPWLAQLQANGGARLADVPDPDNNRVTTGKESSEPAPEPAEEVGGDDAA